MNTSSPAVPFYFQSSEVRTVTIERNPWFVARDVCNILDYADTNVATQFLDDDEKLVHEIDGPGQRRNMLIISESGLYTLIIRSNKPEAKKFRKWVTSEVLPSIRKTGTYTAGPCPSTKRVNVNHTHIRGSLAPQGLDIRYTLDLTKIVLRPTEVGLTLLQRLTGVDVTDLVEDARSMRPRGESVASIVGFVDSCTVPVPGQRVLLADLYQQYAAWAADRGFNTAGIATNRIMAARLRDLGYSVIVRGGYTWVFDMAVKTEVLQ
jgi:prophage antirepressor-like protein